MKNMFTTKILAASMMALSLGLTGCLTDSKDDEEPTPTPVLVTTDTVMVGAQSNATYGSAIDLDGFTSYTIDSAKVRATSIDLIFAYSTSATSSAIYSPDSAKGGINGTAGFDFLATFPTPNATQIKTISLTDISGITTKAQVDSLWAAGTVAANGRVLLDVGTVFLAKSNADLVVLVKVQTLTEAANGSASFVGVAKF